jgi:hypothetical protein
MNGALTWIIIPVPRAFAEGRVAAVHESENGPKENRRNVCCDRRYSGDERTRAKAPKIGPDWSCHLIASAHRAGAIPASNLVARRRMKAPREIGVGSVGSRDCLEPRGGHQAVPCQ